MSVSVPPYRGWLIRITSPGRTWVQSTVEIADMPLENTAAVSPSSHNARRSSSTSRLGLLKREYTRPEDSPAPGSRRPEVKSKKSLPSCGAFYNKRARGGRGGGGGGVVGWAGGAG